MKIKKYIVSFVVLMLSFSLFAGCSNLSDKLGEPGRSSESKTKTVESTDGKFTLEVPTKWTDKTSLNEEAVLSVMNGAQEQYIIVIAESKDNFVDDMTVKDYNDIIIGNMKLALDDCEVTGPDEAAFGNFEGYTTQMRAVAEKLKITYWVTCIESDTDFIQITSWTLQSKEAANKTILSDVVKTFKLK